MCIKFPNEKIPPATGASFASTADIAGTIAGVVGFDGTFRYDTSKPGGTPRKLMESGRLAALGWAPAIGLRDGLRQTYADFLAGHRASN